MRIIFTILFLLGVAGLSAQDITGVWRGHFRSTNRMYGVDMSDRYKFEVQVLQNKSALEGVTYSYKNTEFYAKASAKGSFDAKSGKVQIVELKLIEVRKGFNVVVCSMNCTMKWTKYGNDEFMEGTYTSVDINDSLPCGNGTVFLRKVDQSDFYNEPFLTRKPPAKKAPETVKKNPPVTPAPSGKTPPVTAKAAPPKKNPPVSQPPVSTTTHPFVEEDTSRQPVGRPVTIVPKKDTHKSEIIPVPLVIKTRKNEVTKTITTSEREIELNIYDNGTIDHDTVSVYVDNKLVVSHQMLTLKPIVVKLNLNEDEDTHEVVMVAENLGDIPPNTSLMIIKAGNKRWEVNISSTEQKNAVVIFKFDKGN